MTATSKQDGSESLIVVSLKKWKKQKYTKKTLQSYQYSLLLMSTRQILKEIPSLIETLKSSVPSLKVLKMGETLLNELNRRISPEAGNLRQSLDNMSKTLAQKLKSKKS
jgi:hypothetical protein